MDMINRMPPATAQKTILIIRSILLNFCLRV